MTDKIITRKLKSKFELLGIKLKWPNEVFVKKDGEPYVRITIHPAESGFSAINVNNVKIHGIIIASVFVPKFIGMDKSDEISIKVFKILNSLKDGALICRAAIIKNVPDQPIWFQRNVQVEYMYNNCNGV